MALIIEDGTGSNPAANSYQSISDLWEYAATRGVDICSLSADDSEVLLIKAMDYLETLCFRGEKSSRSQPLRWPRSGVYDSDGNILPDDKIPAQLAKAQLVLALESKDHDLQPTRLPNQAGAISSASLGELSISYAGDGGASVSSPVFKKAESLLAGLTKPKQAFFVRA